MDPHSLLIAVDESEATRRAVEYVATVAAHSLRRIVLFHALPPPPAEMLEHGGVSDQEASEDLARGHRAVQEHRRAAHGAAESGLFQWIRARLHASGVTDDAIVTITCQSPSVRDLVPEILSAAREYRCRTVVVGRESFSRLRELFSHHVCDQLIRTGDGLAVWVVQ